MATRGIRLVGVVPGREGEIADGEIECVWIDGCAGRGTAIAGAWPRKTWTTGS